MQQAVQLRWREGRRCKQDSGFTIVELIIVIIVIAILALIVITTYNGVQQKARNTKTIGAVEAWVKALNLYHADQGDWPAQYSCLGNTNTYSDSGNYCQNGGSPVMSSAFITALAPYLGGSAIPEPDTQEIGDPSSSWKIGGIYNPTSKRIYFAQAGVSSCPKIGGLYSGGSGSYSGGLWCYGNLEQ